MNVAELRQALAGLPDHLPVVIEQEHLDLVGEYVEVMQARFTDTEIYFNPDAYSCDGSRPYGRPDWYCTGTPKRDKPAEPVVILGCMRPHLPTIDGELAAPELESGHP